MSTRELERVEVMGRVAKEELKLIDAGAMLQLSYRQIKRLWRRYPQPTVCRSSVPAAGGLSRSQADRSGTP
jgi:hypothetical protein